MEGPEQHLLAPLGLMGLRSLLGGSMTLLGADQPLARLHAEVRTSVQALQICDHLNPAAVLWTCHLEKQEDAVGAAWPAAEDQHLVVDCQTSVAQAADCTLAGAERDANSGQLARLM